MTAITEDTSHLVAMARSGLATHMLRILPDDAAESGLSGNAEEGAVLDLIADHLDAPVFRLGQGCYALQVRDEQVDALMRAMPGLFPDTEFTVQVFAPPGERASDTQTRVISRIECATEAIQAVLSRLDASGGAAAAAFSPQTVAEQILEVLAGREAALVEAIEARMADSQPVLPDRSQPEAIREAVREALAELPLAEPAEPGEIDALREAVARLEAQLAAGAAEDDSVDLPRQLDERMAAMEETLRAELAARLDGLGDVRGTVADTLSAATGGITRWLQDIDGKLAAAPGGGGAELADRLTALLDRQQREIAALIDARLAALAKNQPERLDEVLQTIRETADAGAANLAAARDENAVRLDAMQAQISDLAGRVASPDLATITEAVAGHMVDLEAALAARIESAAPSAEALQAQIGHALRAPLEEIGRKLAAGQEAATLLDGRIEELSAAIADPASAAEATAQAVGGALDARLETHAAAIVGALTQRLQILPPPPGAQTALDDLGARLDRVERLMNAIAESREGLTACQTEALTARMESLAKSATETLGSYLLGAEDMLQARLDAQHNELTSRLLRHLADQSERIEALWGGGRLADSLAEALRDAQAAGGARAAEALEALTAAVRSLQQTPQADPAIASRLEALEGVLEEGFFRLAGSGPAQPAGAGPEAAAVLDRLAELAGDIATLGGTSAARIDYARQELLARIDELQQDIVTRPAPRAAAAPTAPTDDGAFDTGNRWPVATESMLRRLDAQITRSGEAPLPPPPAQTARAADPAEIVAQLRETEARLVQRIELIAPGEVDAAALHALTDRVERAIDLAVPGTDRLVHLSGALHSILRRLDRQLCELESRGTGGDEIVQDLRIVLAEHLAQMRLAAVDGLRRSA